MKYYRSDIGYIQSHVDLPFTEITEQEYNEAVNAIRRRADYVRKLYNSEIEPTEIPEDIRESVVTEVEQIREAEQRPDSDPEPTETEILSILLGGAS